MCSCHALTVVVREAHAEVSFLDLLNEHVFLVEEEYNRGGCEVAVVADTVEQVQTLVHSILKGNESKSMAYVIWEITDTYLVTYSVISVQFPLTTSSSSTSTMS